MTRTPSKSSTRTLLIVIGTGSGVIALSCIGCLAFAYVEGERMREDLQAARDACGPPSVFRTKQGRSVRSRDLADWECVTPEEVEAEARARRAAEEPQQHLGEPPPRPPPDEDEGDQRVDQDSHEQASALAQREPASACRQLEGITGESVGRSAMGDEWPLEVDRGCLYCLSGVRLVFVSGGSRYAVNGTAIGDRGNLRIDPIWSADPTIPGAKRNIGPLIERGLALCP